LELKFEVLKLKCRRMAPQNHLPRTLVAILSAVLFATASPLFGQAPAAAAAPAIPDGLKPAFALLQTSYPKVEAKRAAKAPADTVWLFRSTRMGEGTIEAGFQGNEVVYMIFRRGTGGAGWKLPEIRTLHWGYSKELLKEKYEGERYNHSLAPQINAAVVTRKDFDPRSLATSM
jgi:hypothetical protein